MSDYRPISCINHERLELAVIKHLWLDVEVLSGEQSGRCRLLPLDVYAQDGMEWLEAETQAGERVRLRLDWLRF